MHRRSGGLRLGYRSDPCGALRSHRLAGCSTTRSSGTRRLVTSKIATNRPSVEPAREDVEKANNLFLGSASNQSSNLRTLPKPRSPRRVSRLLGAGRSAMQSFQLLGKEGYPSRRLVIALIAAIGAAGCGESSPSTPTAPSPIRPPRTSRHHRRSLHRARTGASGWMASSARRRRPSDPGGLIINPTYGSNAPLVALEGAFNASAGSVSAVLQPFGRCFDWDSESCPL